MHQERVYLFKLAPNQLQSLFFCENDIVKYFQQKDFTVITKNTKASYKNYKNSQKMCFSWQLFPL